MSEFWHAVWEHKGLQSTEIASGRSGYGPSQIGVLVEDAAGGLDLRPHDTLLDIGCAAGLMGETLHGMVKRYVGVDFAQSSVDRFKRRCPGFDVRVASATDLSQFSDGEFTKTLLSSVLLVMAYDEAPIALREMRRVTADGGRGFVSGNLRLKPGVKRPDGTGCREHCTCYNHASWYTDQEMIDMAKAAGWRDAYVAKIHPNLSQSEYQFDLVCFT